MDIRKIATDCVDKIEPGLKRGLEAFATSTHPEIKIGRNSLTERREFLIKTVEAAIAEALTSSLHLEHEPQARIGSSELWEIPLLRQMPGKPARAGVFVLCNQHGIFNMLVEEYSCLQDGIPPTLVCRALTPFKTDMTTALRAVCDIQGTWYEMISVDPEVNTQSVALIPPHPEHWEVEGSPVLNVTLVAPMAEQAEALRWFYQRGGNTRSAGPVVVDFPKVDSSRTKITGCIPLTSVENHMRPEVINDGKAVQQVILKLGKQLRERFGGHPASGRRRLSAMYQELIQRKHLNQVLRELRWVCASDTTLCHLQEHALLQAVSEDPELYDEV